MAWSTPATQVPGDLITAAIWNQNVVANPVALQAHGITLPYNDGGSVLATGLRYYVEVPSPFTITRVTQVATPSGSLASYVYKCTYAQFDGGVTHPVAGDNICSATPPTITAATKSQDSTLSGWTVALADGDILAVGITSCATITFASLALKVMQA